MNQYYKGKVAIVTGANRGLGLAMSEKLASMGIKVIMVCRDKIKGEEAFINLQKKGYDLDLRLADVGKISDIENLSHQISKEYKVIDILINNAAINPEKPDIKIETIDFNTFNDIMEINVIGTLWMCKKFIPLIKKSNSGRIINFSSGLGELTPSRMGPHPSYSISKTTVNAITKILANELERFGVIVNSVDPGWVKTDMGGSSAPLSIEEGIDTAIWLATAIPKEIKTGYFYKERKIIPW